MTTIPQRELRNNSGEVLRRAERGERLTITIRGQPVAELGPVQGGRALAAPERLAAIVLNTPADPEFAADLRRMRQEDQETARDPWPA
jgi:prevent-host-death family protein